jgi:HAD superfamily hydrolase (TIGR01509 family)
MGYKVVLWDNDGVLVDTESLFFETTRLAFARLGLVLTREIWGERYLADGKSSREIAVAMGAEPGRAEVVLAERNREYRRVLQHAPAVRPRVRETLAELAGKVRMAIVTGCDRSQLKLAHAASGLLGYFERIVTSDECSNPKPHPELYLTALRALHVDAGDCIAVEDSPRGVAAARAAGIACLAVPTELTAGLRFEGAVEVVGDVSEVRRFLGKG